MRRIILSALVLSGLIANAQNDHKGRVGINTTTPRATLEVSAIDYGANSTKAQGILFPHITNEEKDKWKTDADKGLVAGTVIWNTDKNCLDYFDGTLWQCMDGSQKSIPGNKAITLPQQLKITNGSHWIASIYDTKYLPYSAPTATASWTKGEEDGPDPEIDVKGKIAVAGITIKIPITATGNATLPAYTAYALTPAEAWNDRTAKILELSWEQQNITTSNKTFTATIKVKNATTDQYLTQLDIEKGLGNEYTGLLLGHFKMPSGYTETTPDAYTGTYDVRVTSGIPDRNFGKTTSINGVSKLAHQFIYLPIKAEDGKVWLNNNLGAEYSRLSTADDPNPDFNPGQQAISLSDHKAFGSLFQWQRKADGHELIRWTSATQATPLVTSTSSYGRYPTWEPNHNKFIVGNDYVGYWNKVNGPYNLWQKGGSNNPCPDGFHVPTNTEINTLVNNLETSLQGYYMTNQTFTRLKLVPVVARMGSYREFEIRSRLHFIQGSSGHYYSDRYGVDNEPDDGPAGSALRKDGWSISISVYTVNSAGIPVRCIIND